MHDPFHGRSEDTGDDPLYRKGRAGIGDSAGLLAFLAERDPADAFESLLDGDRLGMLARVTTWMDKRCYLLDLRRVVYGSLAKVVAAGPTIQAAPNPGLSDLGEWVEQRIENTATVLLEEDVRLAADQAPVPEPFEPRFQFLMRNLMFSTDNVRRAVVAANGLRAGERHVFYHCFVIGKGFGRYEEEVGIDAFHARKLLIRAIDKLSTAVGDL
jgi:hypothetical protein